ncbi:hypothetical protein HC251_04460 [Iamia sp. SCSIO 61187]|uniref:hypothetical protein n=1 Tax=Iamia sp. SCSIO 61187 TaxID=2722752 RepID=UPI001C62AAF4|nr:hypothetical protein [Iamia sp. SCSIO 61187]QYG91764.1 hypothetical protein HC251_04460 [Iamia sp. SCSIO 61187]
MPELRRYRLMPLDFNTGHHLLDPVGEGADPAVRAQAAENRRAQIDRLRYIHGEANLEAVIANIQDLGADPFSTIGWHLHLWREVRHAFVSGAYFPAAVGAGAVAERVLNHLLIDLVDDCATEADRRRIEAPKAPTYAAALEILNRWDVLEPASAEHFNRLRIIRNDLVHFNDGLYEDPRGRSLEAITILRDALDAQWGVFVQRRLIPGTPGMMYARKAVEAEPFFRHYLAPVMAYVSPHHGLRHDPDTGLWVTATEEPVYADTDTDAEFVRNLKYLG